MSGKPELHDISKAVTGWWRSLYADPDTGRRGDAGARASLRRAATPLQLMVTPAAHMLFDQLRRKGFQGGLRQDQRIVMAAAVLCETRPSGAAAHSFAFQLGKPAGEEQPRLSPLRFQALIAAMERGDEADMLTVLRRAMAMLKDAPFFNAAFVRDLVAFNDDTAIRWTYDYYHTSRPADDKDDSADDANSELEETE